VGNAREPGWVEEGVLSEALKASSTGELNCGVGPSTSWNDSDSSASRVSAERAEYDVLLELAASGGWHGSSTSWNSSSSSSEVVLAGGWRAPGGPAVAVLGVLAESEASASSGAR